MGRQTAQHAGHQVTILILADPMNAWRTTNQVGITEDIGLGHVRSLALLIGNECAYLDLSEEDNEHLREPKRGLNTLAVADGRTLFVVVTINPIENQSTVLSHLDRSLRGCYCA